ncbi:MAG: sigma-54-dependent Fis family transcriptional regulator [Bacteroidaceae bacterium]|nr:sigma-54-dependent Fis family transcriptional regulator [Bacteroidaceae bacterium]MBR3757636.1 sigma-54-dependent Fis family transcriptional regulator [Bacteroidaceae bacterium]
MVTPEIQQVKLRFGIIGNADGLNRAIDIAMQVAPTDLSVLITGESGVGKEAFPKIIHEYSRRKHSRKYIAVNCGAIPEGTIDSELFGHEKGAFTGAIGERQGYFGEANGGTIFLDEVGELPLATQARLLRVLESGEYIRVGSSKVEKTDVRIVAATNVNLMEAIAEGRFREDLFYRLNTVPITIPPLRERGGDIALLFRKFAGDFADTYRMPAIQLTEEARQILLSYPWPGNVRQLKNITEQISIIERHREITPEILQMYIPAYTAPSRMPALVGAHSPSSGKTFESEREILYQILFDLRRDVTELKRLVNSNLGQMQQAPPQTSAAPVPYYPAETTLAYPVEQGERGGAVVPSINLHTPSAQAQPPKMVDDDDIQDTEEYVEESLSLNDLERETIRKALERHHGRRRNAARDLNISERTLYRKIKDYGLE